MAGKNLLAPKGAAGRRVKKVPSKGADDKATPARWAKEKGLAAFRGAMHAAGIALDSYITEKEFDTAIKKYEKEPNRPKPQELPKTAAAAPPDIPAEETTPDNKGEQKVADDPVKGGKK